MRSSVLALAATVALAGCSVMPSFVGGDKPKAEAAPPAAHTTAVAAAEAQTYQIQYATRGAVRRVKVLLNGRTIETLNMSKGRTGSTSHCCTEDGCEVIDVKKACMTFKMTCDKDGACVGDHADAKTGKL